jgi:hypothetical protein
VRIHRVEDADGVYLGDSSDDLVTGEPLDGSGLVGWARLTGDGLGAEDECDDAKAEVLVDAGELLDLDLDASFLERFPAAPASIVSSSSRMPPGGSQRPLSCRWTSRARPWSSMGMAVAACRSSRSGPTLRRLLRTLPDGHCNRAHLPG